MFKIHLRGSSEIALIRAGVIFGHIFLFKLLYRTKHGCFYMKHIGEINGGLRPDIRCCLHVVK